MATSPIKIQSAVSITVHASLEQDFVARGHERFTPLRGLFPKHSLLRHQPPPRLAPQRLQCPLAHQLDGTPRACRLINERCQLTTVVRLAFIRYREEVETAATFKQR